MNTKVFELRLSIIGLDKSGKTVKKTVVAATVNPAAALVTYHQKTWVDEMKTFGKMTELTLKRTGSGKIIASVKESETMPFVYQVILSTKDGEVSAPATVVEHTDWSRADRAVREALRGFAAVNGYGVSNPTHDIFFAAPKKSKGKKVADKGKSGKANGKPARKPARKAQPAPVVEAPAPAVEAPSFEDSNLIADGVAPAVPA